MTTTARTGVVIDSTADLPEGAKGHDIAVVPLVVNWDNETYQDKVGLTTDEFYRRLRVSRSTPKTGAPSLASFEATFRRQLERFEGGLVCVTLSSKLSGTHDIACQAAESVAPDKIQVVDSGNVTMATGWLAEQAAIMGESGASPREIADRLREIAPRLRVYAILDTLEFLKRGGRIGRAQALAGTLLNVKPIILIQDGEVHPVERVRTLGAATRRLVEIVSGAGPIERLAVLHGDALEHRNELERALQPHFPEMRFDRGEIGSVLGVHGGPGLFGVALQLGRAS
jgi:DegV family protein with EDD domain